MTVTALIRKICCCEGEYSDDEHNLIEDEEEDETHIRSPLGGNSGVSINNIWGTGSTGDSIHGTPIMRNMQTDTEEERMLNEIINATRQNIVIIGNTGDFLPSNDEIQRAKEYDELVRHHDNRLWKLHPPTSSHASIRGESALKDVGEHIAEVLAKDPLLSAEVISMRVYANLLSEAVSAGMQVQHQQEIVVYMPRDEDGEKSE